MNQPVDEAAAPLFARVLAEMFGADPQAAAIVLPTKPLHQMYAEPARRYIEARGGSVHTGASAKLHVAEDGVLTVDAAGERWTAGAVISAVPWFALPDLFEGRVPALEPTLDRARRMQSSPIVTVNIWFDRPVLDEPFVGLPGRAMQWVFDKRMVFGGDASHLSLVSSGASSLVVADERRADRPYASGASRRDPGGSRRETRTGDRHPRAARHVLAGARPAGAAGHRDAHSRASFSRATGSTRACQRRSKAPSEAAIARQTPSIN